MDAAPFSTPLSRLTFRFGLIYLALYSLTANSDVWHVLVPWVAKQVLGLATDINFSQSGSGDMTFNYVQIFCLLILSASGALFWIVLRRGPCYEPALHEALRVLIRYVLAASMAGYGWSKVALSQFQPPDIDRLLQPYGQSSPMGLAWTFLGASPAYSIFGGLLELVGGFLLLWQRTTTLGALLVAGVMGNVVMINLCYDVPVKLYSTHLFLMAVFLLARDGRRLVHLLLLNRPAAPSPERAPFRSVWMRRSRVVMKAGAFIALFVLPARGLFDEPAPRPPLYGLWEVRSFERTGQKVPPLLTDPDRWSRLTVVQPGAMHIYGMNGERLRMTSELNEKAGTLVLSEWNLKTELKGDKIAHRFALRRSGESLTLTGEFRGQPVRIELEPGKLEFPLTSRGFHWINEYPNNH